MKVKPVCKTCGSDQVLADAYAEWDIDKQEWVIQNVFDKGNHCEMCDGETGYLIDVPAEMPIFSIQEEQDQQYNVTGYAVLNQDENVVAHHAEREDAYADMSERNRYMRQTVTDGD